MTCIDVIIWFSLQECLEFSLFPELIATLLYVEALEDNEVVFIENVRQFNRILTDSNKQLALERLDQPKKVRHKILTILINELINVFAFQTIRHLCV